MRVPVPLSEAFGQPFEDLLSGFCHRQGMLPAPEDIRSSRFLSRSVLPHVQKLSALFNRIKSIEEDDEPQSPPSKRRAPGKRPKTVRASAPDEGLAPYWREGSNLANLRLAYLLCFMPPNLFRTASIWAELGRLGYRWPERLAGQSFRGIELGAGPATGACGIAAGENFAKLGLPAEGNWALIEQDKATLELGVEWAQTYFENQNLAQWSTRSFHRRIDFSRALLPATAPKFHLWLMSFFLNEATESPHALASTLMDAWEKHLEDEGLIILVEPALKLQSRRLLELRRSLLDEINRRTGPTGPSLKILLPCLGHQSCGALANPEDWCHEEVSWWRPPYLREIDKMAGLDRKTLPFSYLVLTKSRRSLPEILPKLAKYSSNSLERLVSPAHFEGRDQEFYLCGQSGKRRARFRALGAQAQETHPASHLSRGDILCDAEIRGDVHASRIERLHDVV